MLLLSLLPCLLVFLVRLKPKAHNNIAAINSVINPKMTNLISFIEDMGFVVLFTFLWAPEGDSSALVARYC